MVIYLDGSLPNFVNILAAISALGTASFGLVDATKVYRGGISNIGFGFISDAIKPFGAALELVDADDPLATLRANWINGVAKADQKAKAKSLIRLGITKDTAKELADKIPGVDSVAFAAVAAKIDAGSDLTEDEINLLGRFDAIVDARMDAAFERADQQYRNTAKVLAAVFAIVLSFAGLWIVSGDKIVEGRDITIALLIGILATPLAPTAKDLSSAIGTAVSAIKSVKG